MRGFAVSAAIIGFAAVHAADAEKLTFTPTTIKAPFLEQFTDDWSSRWTPSEVTKKTPVGGETFSYVGQWSVEPPTANQVIGGDKGLVAKTKAAHHAISAPFEHAIDPKGKDLVIQYEAKFQKGGNCGGGYMKLLEDGALANKEFSDTTPWVIMFGPDMTCPGTKVHFIFRHQNPVTKEFEEKHLTTAPTPVIDESTKLYTLIVHPNNTFKVLVDDVVSSEGSLLESFQPPVNPEKEIDDVTDIKPADWVDQVQIPDSAAVKPDDWDEDQPFQIMDEEAVMPEGWLVDEPTDIPDPEAKKPEEWDDEEDGDWIAPTIKNPKCEEGPGCGQWKKPMKTNPLFKGKWSAPMIDNPAYKGPWAPRKVPNPAYFEDFNPAALRPMGAIGFEIWSMTEDILFDNVYIGHSVDDAKKLASETFHVKAAAEKLIKEAEDKEREAKAKAEAAKAAAAAGKPDLMQVLAKLKEDPIGYIREQVMQFVDQVQENGPVDTLRTNPKLGGVIVATILTLFGALGALLGLVGSATKPVSKSTKKADTVAKTNGKEAVAAATAEATSTSTATGVDSAAKKRK